MINFMGLLLTIFVSGTLGLITIVVWALMGFYSVKILKGFKGGVLGTGWKYISFAVPFLVLGQLATGITGLENFGANQVDVLQGVGAIFSIVGGLMMVIGFKAQFDAWNPRGMKQRANDETAREIRPKHDAGTVTSAA
jgi:hypothetical protein